ncbi:alpha-1B-glycoprotein-like [Pangshura tecta]
MASALNVLLLGCWLAGHSGVWGEPSYPKPSISLLSPSWGVSLGGSVSVWCQGQHQGVRFVLNKEGRHFLPVDAVGFGAVFPINNVRREDGGSYNCSYRSRSEPFNVSYPSDPMELVVRDPGLPRPNISLSPTGVTAPGANVTIRCQGQRRDVRFFLHKAGDLNPQRHVDPAGAGAEFHIPTVGRQHGGSYSCSYRPRSEPFVSSEPSDPVQLVVAEPSYPKPNISLSPSWGVSLGGAVAIWCRGQHQGMRFMLNKEGRHFPPVDSAGFGAVFPISNVRREDGGNYNCSYHSRSEPFNVSYPSDPVELVVRDPGLPRPNISLSPTGVTAPGADVTIRCQGQHRDVRFFLHKAGDLNPQPHMDPAGDVAEFRIPSVGRQHGGSYSCSYRPRSEPFVSSQPSDPVQLVVAEINSMTWPIIAGVSAAAAVLLLLVAFVCFRKTRARKGSAPTPSSTSPMGALKAPAQQDSTYTSIDEGKQPQTPPQEPDPGADGLTYAELNHQPLQAKQGSPVPAPQPGVYAAINWCAEKESPQLHQRGHCMRCSPIPEILQTPDSQIGLERHN